MAWLKAYDEARRLLFAGEFAEARRRFTTLAQTAPDSARRALVTEQATLAAYWEGQGAVLVTREEAEDSTVIARRQNRRTTDEVAVLYLNSIFYGVGTGAWLATHTEPDSVAGAVLPSLGLAGAAAGTVALIDSGRGLGYGVPQAIVSGMYLGLEEGLVLAFWNQARVRYFDEWEDTTLANIIWGSATAGAVAGGALGSLYGTTPGRASYVGSAGLWSGVVLGLAAGAATSDEETLDDNALLAGAIGLNAGAIAGVFTANQVAPSIARVRFLDLGALGGGLLLGGIALSIGEDESFLGPGFALTAMGVSAGLVTAWLLTDGMPKERLPSEGASRSLAPRISVGFVPTMSGAQAAVYGSF